MADLSPIDWAKRPLQKYAVFSGRAPRSEFWWYTLAVIIASVVANIIDSILGFGGMLAAYGLVSLVLALALLVPGIAVTVRRLHDTNRSGWWILIALVPYGILAFMIGGAAATGDMGAMATAGLFGIVALIGAIVLLVFMVLPGTPGDNRYGPDPYGGGVAAPAE